MTHSEDKPQRVIHLGDGVDWLRNASLGPNDAIVTSLPDVSGLPDLGFDAWRAWFTAAAEQACRSAHEDAFVIFYQTDIKHEGRWVDKSLMVSEGAARAKSHLLWRKVVCRVPPGTTTFGRPAYAHLLCFSREALLPPGQSTPDVLPQVGDMSWSRAMGSDVCDAVIRFLKAHTKCTTVVDPFCGHGSILAAANARGLDAVGVEISRRRALKAGKLVV
ncbi:MAG: SAM-dependent methyltransferase [Polyangiales bacterium]